MINIKVFPDKFLWGVATSAFQLEGSPYADWASWDSILNSNPDVTNHYTLYKEDLNLLKELGVNAYRFSLEWSRIQPKENAWDDSAIAHYQEIIDILLENNAFMTGNLNIKFPFTKEINITVPIKDKLDFFGVNYYTRVHIRFNPFKKMGVELRHRDIDGYGLTDMGWEIHPHGLEKVLRYASKLSVPLIITENGIATHECQKKIIFMKRHVDVVERCKNRGMDIRGYFYWSLIDNYEWIQGFDARFGLYRVDFETLERKPTNAAAYYSYLIKSRSSL